jgi:hypothetical protein
MSTLLTYIGAGIIFLWGVGHLVPTRNIVRGFGSLGDDNRRIITMEWLAEGLTLCFIGVLAAVTQAVAGPGSLAATIVLWSCAAMLLVLATLSVFTGARTSILPMRLCPIVKSAAAVLFIAATF